MKLQPMNECLGLRAVLGIFAIVVMCFMFTITTLSFHDPTIVTPFSTVMNCITLLMFVWMWFSEKKIQELD